MLPSVVPCVIISPSRRLYVRALAMAKPPKKNANSEEKKEEKQSARGPQLLDDHLSVIMEECYKNGVLGEFAEDGEMRTLKDCYILVTDAVNAKMPAINEAILAASKNKRIELPTTLSVKQCTRKFKDACRRFKEVRSV